MTRAEFVARHPRHYFVKRPRAGATGAKQEGAFGLNTVAAKIDVDPFADEWRVVPGRRARGQPVPGASHRGTRDQQRRAPARAVRLEGPCARDQEPDGSFSIRDDNPSNRTFLQNRVLEAGATRKLAVGDPVGFGSLEFEFVDAARLYDILIAECGSTRDSISEELELVHVDLERSDDRALERTAGSDDPGHHEPNRAAPVPRDRRDDSEGLLELREVEPDRRPVCAAAGNVFWW